MGFLIPFIWLFGGFLKFPLPFPFLCDGIFPNQPIEP